ncbi:MAG: CTP synthase, partial [Lachnospiraceae bacterium]|nr:CTP synthase [Lachnospiraceae bacterium]
MVKYVFVTGGVVSGLGKGITAASLGRLLKARGYRVTMQKFDPYINVDPGTMNPIQHGEVFVTDDGTETDLDLGHYERFINESLDKNSNVTTGKIYQTVLNRERHGDYGGGTVQVIPHITNEIKERFHKEPASDDVTISIIEIGGTVGDIESQPFLEAIRQFQVDIGRSNSVIIHVTLIPYLKASGELKTKPTQMSVKTLQSMGLWPDIIVCRSDLPIDESMRGKIALFCNVKAENVLQNLDAPSLYEVPLMLEEEHLAERVCECLGLSCPEPDLTAWKRLTQDGKNPRNSVTVAIVGKYVALHDAYLSVAEALKHGGIANLSEVKILWVDAEDVTDENASDLLAGADGIIVPGGFGSRGTDGKIAAIRYARTGGIPYLGICLGMQLAIVEFARNVCGLKDAASTELFPETKNPVIHIL